MTSHPDNINTPDTLAPPKETVEFAPEEVKGRRFFLLFLMLLAGLAIFSFNPADLDFYAGGVAGSAYPYNYLATVGTYFSWILFATIGLGTYPLYFLTLFCCIRRAVWRRKLRFAGWEYYASILLFGIGLSFLFGASPGNFADRAAAVNIQGFPGGVVGNLFCSAPSGLLLKLIGHTGCVLTGLAVVVATAVVIWFKDWHDISQPFWKLLCEKLHEYLERRRAAKLEGEELREAEVDLGQEQHVEADYPYGTQGGQGAVAQTAPMTAQPGEGGFRARRGQASIDAGRQAAEAINGTQRRPEPPVTQQPPRRQPELPMQPADTPQPTAAPAQRTPSPAPAPQPAPHAPASQGAYAPPNPLSFFMQKDNARQKEATASEIQENLERLQSTLDEFNMDAEVVNAIPGPQVTLYEIKMGDGVALNRLKSLQDNIAMNLRAKMAIRMLLPIPGKNYAGIEVPNRERATVCARELFDSDAWRNTKKHIPLMLGKNINNEVRVIDLEEAPHLLVAGASGSGKSGCMTLLMQSLLLRFPPDMLRLIMLDAKFLEFAPYSAIPHLECPIINDPAQAVTVLSWACVVMDKRYRQMAAVDVKKLEEFNSRPPDQEPVIDSDGDVVPQKLPYLIIIIDELQDLILRARKDIENSLSRLGGKARAAGIHMIIATQRPSANVVSGLIKANFPWRIALQVTDAVNSRVILDSKGAETLLGKGDMLFSSGGANFERIQCGWVENKEVAAIARACSDQSDQNFDESLLRALETRNADEDSDGGTAGGSATHGGTSRMGDSSSDDPYEALVLEALKSIERTQRPTISVLQRQLRIGYNKAADLMDELEHRGYVGPQPISGMREIYFDNFPGNDSFAKPATDAASPDDSEENAQDADTADTGEETLG